MRSIALVVVLTAVACGGSKPQPTTPPANPPVTEPAPPADPPAPVAGLSDAEFEVLMGKAVAMFTAMGDAADQSGGDCGKLAGSLDQVMADNRDFIDSAKQYKDSREMDAKAEEWMKAHQDQVMGPMMKVAELGQKCAEDPEFMAVMEKLSKIGE